MDTQPNPDPPEALPAAAVARSGDGVSRASVQRGLVLTLAASAGAHLALVPSHLAERPLVGVLFAASALALAGTAVSIDRRERRAAVLTGGLLLAGLILIYVAARLVVVWPLAHVEPVDAVGVLTKLVEAAGLALALRLLQTPEGCDQTLPSPREGAAA